jgi:hypothetical protein
MLVGATPLIKYGMYPTMSPGIKAVNRMRFIYSIPLLCTIKLDKKAIL